MKEEKKMYFGATDKKIRICGIGGQILTAVIFKSKDGSRQIRFYAYKSGIFVAQEMKVPTFWDAAFLINEMDSRLKRDGVFRASILEKINVARRKSEQSNYKRASHPADRDDDSYKIDV